MIRSRIDNESGPANLPMFKRKTRPQFACGIREQLEQKRLAERRRITLNEVAKEVGVSRTTINRIANIPGYNTNTDTIDALCKHFECTNEDLLEFLPSE